jgi:hypothetical protein
MCRASLFILVNMVGLARDDARSAICKSTRHALAAGTGCDVKAAKPKRSSDEVRRFDGNEMELARGASHIASMLYEHSIRAAVGETLLQFEGCHGREDLQAFAYALLGKLEQRGKPEAVKLLYAFLEHGRLPEVTPGALPVPVATRKPVVRKRRMARSMIGRAAAMT